MNAVSGSKVNEHTIDKINIIGGGPAGLYFAILVNKDFPEAEINIYERNNKDDMEGWGIVINMGTINLLKKNDPQSYDYLLQNSQIWSDVDIDRNGEKISVHGKEYRSISRNLLISTLRQRCESLNIPIHYEHKITDLNEVNNCDLLVGADGAYSFVRTQLQDHFDTSIDMRPDRFIWLGTTHVYKTITHLFKQTDMGTFSVECYPYSDSHSTFIVTCNEQTYEKAALENKSLKDSLKMLETLFEDELEGKELLARPLARWVNFPLVTNKNWAHPRVLLLGDALHTAHFSIGSGTRLALEDAIVAAQALEENESIETSLQAFQRKRQPYLEKYQQVALESLVWFENIEEVIELELIPFTFELMTRSDKLGIRSLKLQDPKFVETYLKWKSAQDL